MLQRVLYLLKTYLLTVLFFVIAKMVFMFYNSSQEYSGHDIIDVLWHGLSLDLSMSLYIFSVPFLVCVAAIWLGGNKVLRIILRVYYALIAVAMMLAFVADTSLYEFWLFKLDASCLQYLETPTEAMASVSTGYIIIRILIIIVGALLVYWAYMHPRWNIIPSRHRITESVIAVLCIPLIVIGIRGGFGKYTRPITLSFSTTRQSILYLVSLLL